MNIVPFPGSEGSGGESLPPIRITEENEPLYRELFQAVHPAVTMQPWEKLPKGLLFSMPDEVKGASWGAELVQGANGPHRFRLNYSEEGGRSDGRIKLEVQFLASDFLQDDDYELNVRFAPEEWDELELDVIVLRSHHSGREARQPNNEELLVLCDGLRLLNVKHLNSNELRVL